MLIVTAKRVFRSELLFNLERVFGNWSFDDVGKLKVPTD